MEDSERCCLPYFADDQKYPKLNDLIKEISEKLSEDCSLISTKADLDEVDASLENAKIFYFKHKIVYDELMECLQEQTPDGKEIIPSHLADIIHAANAESLACLKSDESNEKLFLFGLKEKDFKLADPQIKASIQQYLIPIIEQRLRDKCLQLQRFWDPDSENDSDSLALAKAQQLPQLISDMKNNVKESEKTITRLECQNISKMVEYEKVLCQNMAMVSDLIKECKSEDNINANEATLSWLVEKQKTLAKKQEVIRLKIMLETYTEENVAALKKVRSELINRIQNAEKSIKDGKSTLRVYESLGDEFQNLARQYAKLNAEIDNKKWALAELKSTSAKE